MNNENIEQYYDNTESDMPRKDVKYFVEKIQCKPSNAVELGVELEMIQYI